MITTDQYLNLKIGDKLITVNDNVYLVSSLAELDEIEFEMEAEYGWQTPSDIPIEDLENFLSDWVMVVREHTPERKWLVEEVNISLLHIREILNSETNSENSWIKIWEM